MSQLRIASDLHLEFFRGSLSKLAEHFLPRDDRDGESVLVLAGDISSSVAQLREFIYLVSERFAGVVYVPGNHEYYRSDYDEWNADAKAALGEIPGVVAAVGRVGEFKVDGLRFICGTLWGDGGDTKEEAKAIGDYLNDFRLIRRNGKPFTVGDMATNHQHQRAGIVLALMEESNLPTVVVTHHMPSYSLSHPRFGNACTGGFAGRLDKVMHGPHAPALWIHGHTHDTFDRTIGKTRVVCNPAGYHPEWNTEFNSFFAAPKFVHPATGGRGRVNP